MDEILTILLVEDDLETCELIQKYAENFSDIKIVNTTNNSYSAYNYVVEHNPDAVILDLELHDGGGNGILFLDELYNNKRIKKPYIVITTHTTSQTTFNNARELGADFILYKHSDGYTFRDPINFLRIVRKTILKSKNSVKDYNTVSPEAHNEHLLRMIKNELNIIGINPKVLGYDYLTDAILYCINEGNKKIFEHLAKKYSKSVQSVEHAMINSITTAWTKTSTEVLEKHYTAVLNRDSVAPTCLQFINYYAKKLENN